MYLSDTMQYKRKPLPVPFDGPYKVLKRSDKNFTLDVNGQQKVISLDHLEGHSEKR